MDGPPAPDSYVQTDRGRVRANNEDAAGWFEPAEAELRAQRGFLYVVADGMGGHAAGEVAARLAVDAVLRGYYSLPWIGAEATLRAAVAGANAEVHAEGSLPGDRQGMGCTVVVAAVAGENAVVANVGDSRAYLLRGGVLRQVSEDHSLLAEGLAAGTISPEQAKTHPGRNVITRNLGVAAEVEPAIALLPLVPGDRLLLCSDGLWGLLGDREIGGLTAAGDAETVVSNLIAAANAAGGRDNIGVALVCIGEPSHRRRAGVLGDLLPPLGTSLPQAAPAPAQADMAPPAPAILLPPAADTARMEPAAPAASLRGEDESSTMTLPPAARLPPEPAAQSQAPDAAAGLAPFAAAESAAVAVERPVVPARAADTPRQAGGGSATPADPASASLVGGAQPRGRGPRYALPAAVAAAVILAGGAIAVVAVRGGGGQRSAPASGSALVQSAATASSTALAAVPAPSEIAAAASATQAPAATAYPAGGTTGGGTGFSTGATAGTTGGSSGASSAGATRTAPGATAAASASGGGLTSTAGSSATGGATSGGLSSTGGSAAPGGGLSSAGGPGQPGGGLSTTSGTGAPGAPGAGLSGGAVPPGVPTPRVRYTFQRADTLESLWSACYQRSINISFADFRSIVIQMNGNSAERVGNVQPGDALIMPAYWAGAACPLAGSPAVPTPGY